MNSCAVVACTLAELLLAWPLDDSAFALYASSAVGLAVVIGKSVAEQQQASTCSSVRV